jgi:hypothetical protein
MNGISSGDRLAQAVPQPAVKPVSPRATNWSHPLSANAILGKMLNGYETVVAIQRKIRVTPAANEVIERCRLL